MPESIHALSELQLKYHTTLEEDHITTKFRYPNTQLCKLRAQVASPKCNLKSTAIIAKALSIITEFERWHAELPASIRPSTFFLNKPTTEVLSDHYHRYCDLWASTIFNSYRTCSILCHEMIIHELSLLHQRYYGPGSTNLDYDPTGYSESFPFIYVSQIHQSQRSILEFIDEICASVPFHLSYQGEPESLQENGSSSPLPPPPAAGGNSVLWQLFAAGQINFCPKPTRMWIIGRLQKIGTEMGVRQAMMLAKVLKMQQESMEFRPYAIKHNESGDDDKLFEEEGEGEEAGEEIEVEYRVPKMWQFPTSTSRG